VQRYIETEARRLSAILFNLHLHPRKDQRKQFCVPPRQCKLRATACRSHLPEAKSLIEKMYGAGFAGRTERISEVRCQQPDGLSTIWQGGNGSEQIMGGRRGRKWRKPINAT
jgi:hypothetical protein